MSNPKMNNTRWHVQGLVVLMCILLPVLATGTAEARYRAEKTAEIQFQIWEPAQIYLGTLSGTTETEGEGTAATPEELTFHPDGELTWTESLGTYSMELAVANGSFRKGSAVSTADDCFYRSWYGNGIPSDRIEGSVRGES